jgi:lipopolysaccharide biosynthesis regulator YciM
MLCVCLRERGEPDKAITMLQTLLKPELSEEDSCAVKYELASTYEAAGNPEAANTLLNEINSIKPGFRDISARLDAASVPESLDFSDEDLKDF